MKVDEMVGAAAATRGIQLGSETQLWGNSHTVFTLGFPEDLTQYEAVHFYRQTWQPLVEILDQLLSET